MRTTRFGGTSQRVDVPKLLDSLGIVVAKREGRTLKALCPNPAHDDGSPSWSIIDDHRGSRNGYHYCFSCQFGGGPMSLIAAVMGLDFDESRKYLDELPGHQHALAVELEITRFGTERQGIVFPDEVVFDAPLSAWPKGAREYLVEERRVTPEQVHRYQIGFCTEGRLRGRIVLPMMDATGLRSYTARDYTNRSSRRYLEPARAENAQQDAIFGEHTWMPTSDTLAIAEGPFDTLALDGLRPALDTCALHGSRLYPTQAVKLSRYARILIITDPDSAGDRVADEITAACGRYTEVLRARPPEGEDCSSMGQDALVELLESALGE